MKEEHERFLLFVVVAHQGRGKVAYQNVVLLESKSLFKSCSKKYVNGEWLPRGYFDFVIRRNGSSLYILIECVD